MNGMKYIITGATSFLGVELTKSLIQQGQQVVAICRQGSRGLENLPKQVDFVCFEMDEYRSLPAQVNHADVFIHCAWAGTGKEERDMIETQNRNIEYSLDAMRSAHQLGCELFVMAGSQAEYGSTIQLQNEDMPCNPFSEYGKAKLQVQQDCSRLAEELGMKYLHLRIFSLFGENDHPWTLVMSCIDKMLRNEPIELSSCTQNWNFLYVKDAAWQIVQLCEYALETDGFNHEIYNVASDDTRPLKQFVEYMKKMTKSQSELRYGTIVPERFVSLQPSLAKLQMVVKEMRITPFELIIKKIVNSRR